MIVVKYKSFQAVFDGNIWKSDDSDFQQMLNDSWDEVEVSVASQYRDGPKGTIGLDGLALEAAIQFLGVVDIVAYQALLIVPEEKGVLV